ncbi:AMP-binding protein [Nakamurella sp. YIM 132087]|uniref:AMP-binding protein n=1 Tax=Nakamurella alba TaxID=2665158 RepID=A0A7K1FT24_9ACTN|nr:AMP-binding protein [Nakamurella alba]MTD15964.1 AMP-binding protein [Nakamurella alba]
MSVLPRAPQIPMERRTVPALLDDGARAWADRPALRDAVTTLTYAGLRDAARARGAALAALGIARRQTCLLMMDNHLDHVLTWLGAACFGRVQAQVNTAYRGSLLAHVVNNSDADTIVIEDRYATRLLDIEAEIPALRRVVVRGAAPEALRHSRFEVLDFETSLLVSDAAEPADADDPVRPWDPYAIMYTSGTTGPSKGVLQPHGLPFSYVDPHHWPLVDGDDVVLEPLPQFHIAGQWTGVLAPLMVGGSCALVERFSASGFLDEVRRFCATQVTMMASMVTFLLAQPVRPDDADTTLRKVLMAPVIKEEAAFRARFGVEIACGLGQTESSAPVVAQYGQTVPGGCGWIRDDFEARVVDADDIEVAPGEVGELAIRPRMPHSVMIAYHHAPDATLQKWRGLWLHLGDMVRQDATGQFFFVDRSSDVIRRRGENISSVEVESEILRIPGISGVGVVGVRSADYEQEVLACVELAAPDAGTPGSEWTAESLHAELRRRLPYFMVPRYIEVYDELPRTPTAKVQKGELRAAGLTDRVWDARAHGVEARHDSP